MSSLIGCGGSSNSSSTPPPVQPPTAETSDGPGPDTLDAKFMHPDGDVTAGRDVFRYETFGNQRFWTDAVQLPQGIAAAGVTPLQALQLGLNVNFEALNDPTKQALADALAAVQGGADPNSTAFGDPAVTLSLINQNAVQGVVVFGPDGQRKPLGNTGSLDLAAGDKVGVTCAVCHAATDNSVLGPNPDLHTAGSVGVESDGQVAEGIDIGAIFAAAGNTRALFPLLQISFNALGGASIGFGHFSGLVVSGDTIPTEEETDAYLTGTNADGLRYYPRVSFDAFPDGIGAPTYIPPFFKGKLAAPWGFDGGVNQLQDFDNTVYTVALDPTSLLTPDGRAVLHALAGGVGDEIADSYQKVLVGTGVLPPDTDPASVFPYIDATSGTYPAGSPQAIVGLRVDETKLLDLNAYIDSLPGPAPASFDQTMANEGREIFRTISDGGGKCTQCHQVDPDKFVPTDIVPIQTLYPAYAPTVIADRGAPLDAIQNSDAGPDPYYDDRVVVFDASVKDPASNTADERVRGYALPLLLDLSRKHFLLHDSSVGGDNFDEAAELLLDPSRGANAPHPFYIEDADDRAKVVEFLKSLSSQ